MPYAYALLESDEALRSIKQAKATTPQTEYLNDALFAASEEIQQQVLGRIIVKLNGKHWIEYHERSRRTPSRLHMLHWPIQADWGSLEIAEDLDHVYGADTVLVDGTDYRIIDQGDHTSEIVRLSNESPTAWMAGHEAIRVTMKGGWSLANIPPAIKKVCRKYTALLYKENMDQSFAFQSINDETGAMTKFAPAMLMAPMMRTLAEYRDFGVSTCVRFTEEDDGP